MPYNKLECKWKSCRHEFDDYFEMLYHLYAVHIEFTYEQVKSVVQINRGARNQQISSQQFNAGLSQPKTLGEMYEAINRTELSSQLHKMLIEKQKPYLDAIGFSAPSCRPKTQDEVVSNVFRKPQNPRILMKNGKPSVKKQKKMKTEVAPYQALPKLQNLAANCYKETPTNFVKTQEMTETSFPASSSACREEFSRQVFNNQWKNVLESTNPSVALKTDELVKQFEEGEQIVWPNLQSEHLKKEKSSNHRMAAILHPVVLD